VPEQRQRGKSGSILIYGLLLEIYLRRYLRRHREELLQNFRDLEQDLSSNSALWSFIAKDLAVSFRSEVMRTFWGQIAVVFTALGLMLMIAKQVPDDQNATVTDTAGKPVRKVTA
jgi:predicted permease